MWRCCGRSRGCSGWWPPIRLYRGWSRAWPRDAPAALKAIRAARAGARARAWDLAGGAAPGADGGLVTVDIDATIVTACSEKEQAAPTWKKTYGLLTELPELSSQFREWLASWHRYGP